MGCEVNWLFKVLQHVLEGN